MPRLLLLILGVTLVGEEADGAAKRDRPPFLTKNAPALRSLAENDGREPQLFSPTPNDAAVSGPTDTVEEEQIPLETLRQIEPAGERGRFDGSSSSFRTPYPLAGSGASTAALRGSNERDRLLARAARGTVVQDYNVKLGPLPLKFAAGFGIDVSDNINGETANRKADVILRPQLDVTGSIKISRLNSLTVQLGIGYLWDTGDSDRNTPLTTAALGLDNGSEIAFDIKLGNFLINVHELPEIPRQQLDFISQRSLLGYSRFTNVAGITALWDINSRLAMSSRYDHINNIGLTDEAKRLGSTDDRISLLLQYAPGERVKLGVNGSSSALRYSESVLNNAQTYQVGMFVEYVLTDYVEVQATVGKQFGMYGDGGITGDTSSLKSYYWNFSLVNNLNAYVRQVLSVGHEAQAGAASNFVETNYLRHQAQWELIAGVRLATFAFLEDARESGGLFAQDIRRFGGGITAGIDITKRLSLQVQYSYVNRSGSGSPDLQMNVLENTSLDYYENRLTMEFRYAL